MVPLVLKMAAPKKQKIQLQTWLEVWMKALITNPAKIEVVAKLKKLLKRVMLRLLPMTPLALKMRVSTMLGLTTVAALEALLTHWRQWRMPQAWKTPLVLTRAQKLTMSQMWTKKEPRWRQVEEQPKLQEQIAKAQRSYAVVHLGLQGRRRCTKRNQSPRAPYHQGSGCWRAPS